MNKMHYYQFYAVCRYIEQENSSTEQENKSANKKREILINLLFITDRWILKSGKEFARNEEFP